MNSKSVWTVYLPARAEKNLLRAPKREQDRVRVELRNLSTSPLSGDIKKIGDNAYRRRVGDWRIIFTLKKEKLLVIIISVERRTSSTY
jgi:mRNA interferase RelE/StbE